jgi:DNA-directed RNA polymerase specialized sigma24 family protein
MSATAQHEPVEVLVDRVRSGRQPTMAEADAVRALLRLWLSRRRLDPDERESVCDDAILRLIQMARDGRLDPDRPPGALLRVIADHLALDVIRGRPRYQTVNVAEFVIVDDAEDERIARMLLAEAAAADVRRALLSTAEDGRDDVVRIVSAWLGLAAANDEAPSTRELAERLGVSHMTVQRALQTFKSHLAG